jgi:BirA family biotin operon repressor/biotin-[acetyl-CoA-carboxylase] ligase
VGGRKICGTLLELSTEADAVRFVIVGIGLNVNMTQNEMTEEIHTKATSLALEAKKVFERAQVCGILLANLERYYDLAKKDGLKTICGLWEEKARIKGTYIEVVQPERVFRGVAEGIDTEGALLLNQEGTITRIIAGDVTF